jgi:hypothetical protein
MFRPRREPLPATTVAVEVEGRRVRLPAGASAAAALLAAGWRTIRETPPSTLRQAQGSGARGPYCMIGVCFECLAEIDGVPNRQSCMVTVSPGMKIRRQRGAPRIDPGAGS